LYDWLKVREDKLKFPLFFICGNYTLSPLNYLPIFTFTSKISSVTLNLPKLSNCSNLTHLTYLFPKCPHRIFLKKKKIQKEKRKNQTGGRPPRLARGWFGHPQAGHLGEAEPPLGPLGVVRPPLGPIAQIFVFGSLAQGSAEPPPRPLNGVAGHPSIYILVFFFFFFFFFLKKQNNVMWAFCE
jgi:hypothetical protein